MLEIMIVLALVAVVMGGGIALMVFSDNQRDLRRMADEIEVMAKRARAVALLQQTPYALEFTEGRVRMMPLVEAGMEVQDLPPVSDTGAEMSPDQRRQTPVRRELAIGGGIRMALRRWGATDFIPVEGKRALQVWRFDPNGLCEPVSVRLVQGDNWIEDVYHPLTAAVCDSAMSMK